MTEPLGQVMGIFLVLFILLLHTLSFAFPIIIIILVIKHIKKVVKEGYQPPPTYSHQDYGTYVYEPIRLPKQLDFHHSPIGNLISFVMCGLFGVAWVYMVITGLKNGGTDGLWIAVIGSLIFGLLFFAGVFHLYKRIHHKESFFVLMTSDSIKYEYQTIPYQEIVRIYHSTRRAESEKSRRTHRYMTIESPSDFIRLSLSSFKAEQWAEIINCCLYHNPSIVLDQTAFNILVNKKISSLRCEFKIEN